MSDVLRPALLSPLFRVRASLRAGVSAAVLSGVALLASAGAAQAQSADRDDPIRQAKEALQKRDKGRLAALKATVTDSRHPLAPWVDYWELTTRLGEVNRDEVDAFFARWPGSYVEDRLRNDWLLELGRRRDWAGVARELPRFKMNDDREVSCYGQLAELQAGKDVRESGRRAWLAQKDPDDGCQALAQALVDNKLLSDDDVWRKLRWAVELNRQKLARNTANLLGDRASKPLAEILDNPAKYLQRKASALGHYRSELTALAVARLAASDAAGAAQQLSDRWGDVLTGEHGAWAWAQTAKQGALSLNPDSLGWVRTAWSSLGKRQRDKPDWSDETLGWLARAALRLGEGDERWTLTLRAIDAMSPVERSDPTWQYWRARAWQALAKPGEAGDTQRAEARQALQALSTQLNFYGQLAAEDLGAPQALPAAPAAPTPAEREAARNHPGLQRALLALAAGLRPEGVREWNFSLIGMSDRELLAAAQMACEKEVWDRCINSAERARGEVDMALRYPLPLRNEMLPKARDIGLDAAQVYGLIRQESRFVTDARSAVGASGLMQVMPGTAKWTAKKIGFTDFRPDMLSDRDTNLRLGTAYLKLVLDDVQGSLPMAAAAYNAGPGRPRKWRDGPVLDPVIWTENIPFNETRDYVKKVVSNATYYAALISGKPAALRARLGPPVGPRDANAKQPDPELP